MRLPRRPLALLSLTALFASPVFAQAVRTGTVAERYAQLCASCHGDKLQGAQAPSMLDEVWAHGSDDESLAKSIRAGFPEKGMPGWGAAIPEKEIRAMVIYIREQRALFQRGQMQFNKPADSVTAKSELHDFQVNTWVSGLVEPWGLAFLPDGRAIVTEKNGYAYVIDKAGKLAARPLNGLPAVDTGGQAGLFDVVPHPDFAKNGWIYFAFSDPQTFEGKPVSITRIVRGKIKANTLVEQETIFQAPIELYRPAGGVHFGGRIAFDKAGYLYFTIGERGQGPHAQDITRPNGKVHRVTDDGRIPDDNPFAKDVDPKVIRSIWSFGHRNPQGLAYNAATDQLFDVEHGPRGGDEVNWVRKGLNYGWPVITYGMNYDGTAMTDITAKEGMEQPVTYYVPSIAPCGANFYTGDLFPKWKGQLFVASLAAEELRRLEIKDGKLVTQEVLFKGLSRIRHVIGGPDGALYVLLSNRIARVTPAQVQ